MDCGIITHICAKFRKTRNVERQAENPDREHYELIVSEQIHGKQQTGGQAGWTAEKQKITVSEKDPF